MYVRSLPTAEKPSYGSYPSKRITGVVIHDTESHLTLDQFGGSAPTRPAAQPRAARLRRSKQASARTAEQRAARDLRFIEQITRSRRQQTQREPSERDYNLYALRATIEHYLKENQLKVSEGSMPGFAVQPISPREATLRFIADQADGEFADMALSLAGALLESIGFKVKQRNGLGQSGQLIVGLPVEVIAMLKAQKGRQS